MIKPFPLSKMVGEHAFVPQALIARPIWDLAKRLGADLETGFDELDKYQGAGAILDNSIPFAVMHYQGHPDDTSTIYLRLELEDVHIIAKIISMIVSELQLPAEAIKWQRGMKF